MAATSVRRVCNVGATLGEGPVWVGREQALWFVDIKQKRLHRFDPATNALTSWDAPSQIGWVLPASGGGFVVGMQRGIERFDAETGEFTSIVQPEPHLPGNRLNDATTDSRGCIWFGSMDDGEADVTGHLYALDAGGVRHAGLDPVSISRDRSSKPDMPGRSMSSTRQANSA